MFGKRKKPINKEVEVKNVTAEVSITHFKGLLDAPELENKPEFSHVT